MILKTQAEREQLHSLVDHLTPQQADAVRGLLEAMVDPISQKLALAPLDDEPFTDEDRLAVAQADEWRKHNEPIALDAILADFDLTLADWEKMGRTPLPTNGG